MAAKSEYEVRIADRRDLALCASTLAAAFHDYPWTRWVVPEDDYDERLRALHLAYLGYASDNGFVAVSGARAGVAAMVEPHAAEPSAALRDHVRELHGDRIDRLGHTPFPAEAWRLETLGVDPGQQGLGIASGLLRFALHEVARRDATIVMLETSDARNVSLYERHGFRTISCATLANGVPVWRMSTNVSEPDSKRAGFG